MRRRISITALLLAWLCANGAVWNVVQVVAWGQMFATNLTCLSVGQALAKTFDGSQPCELCTVVQAAQATTQESSPAETATRVGLEKLLLIAETAPAFVLSAPAPTWPGIASDLGPTRTDPVPVTPPRV